MTTPRIYVACLAAYNSGTLHGAWIDATDADTIQDEVAAMLKASPEPGAEEWAIHDHEGFLGVKVEEYAGFEEVAALAEALEEHGEPFAAWLNDGGDLDDTAGFEEAFEGIYDSEEAFAERLVEDLGYLQGVPEAVVCYFDYGAFARDLFIGDYWMDDDSGAVFRRM